MKVLINGATGFIGSNITNHLLSCTSSELIIVSRNECPDNYEGLRNLNWIQHDLSLSPLKQKNKIDIDIAFHMTGKTYGSELDINSFKLPNEHTLINFLKSDINIKKLIFPSSYLVYGNVNSKNIKESNERVDLSSNYRDSKINCENYLSDFQRREGTSVIIFRMTGFIEGGGLLDYIIDRALKNQTIKLYSKGEISRDYISMPDFLDLATKTIEKDFTPETHIFNIGSGQAYTTKELSRSIIEITGSKSELALLNKKATIEDFIFNIDRAREELNFSPNNLLDSIQKYTRYKMSKHEG
jgi:nucleoside-diphosphate-sugar epimerase